MADIKTLDSFDMEQALLDPGSVFGSPEAVLVSGALSRDQKIEVLRRWEYDASENGVALEEGMRNGESELLRRILLALGELTGGIDAERVGPTKQHGILSSVVKRT